jgi:hypothetical protein
MWIYSDSSIVKHIATPLAADAQTELIKEIATSRASAGTYDKDRTPSDIEIATEGFLILRTAKS